MTGHVQLRDLADDDLPVLFEHQRDPDANRMAAFPARDREAYFAHQAKVRADPTTISRAIVFDGRLAGRIDCVTRDGRRLVGYWLGKEYWGKGIASRALAAFLEVVRERPLYAFVATHNRGSIRVLEKCGFAACGPATVGRDGVEEVLMELPAAP